MSEPIIAGVDGSRGALAAVLWAADDAARRGCDLRIVHVEEPLLHGGQPYERSADDPVRREGERLLAEAAAMVAESRPNLHTSTELLFGDPDEILRAQAAEAAVIVVGSRGIGGFTGLLLGSVSLGLAGHAPGPVVVVRGTPAVVQGEIVAGFDPEDAVHPALDYAFEEAQARGARLWVVHAWDLPSSRVSAAFPLDLEFIAQARQKHVHDMLSPWLNRYPGVIVTESVFRGNPIAALCETSAHADLVVVGSRGRGVIRSAMLGSVSHGVLHYASGPVAVVRPRA
ncbi:universal stress protein [Nonomuraea maheshkhaliensis]|uniref:Universal stress protein n=1 Tax=Nonomuraea maheshkhaliensis TaxID=419590 RepID=A0ABN2F996_9ACTN